MMLDGKKARRRTAAIVLDQSTTRKQVVQTVLPNTKPISVRWNNVTSNYHINFLF